MHGRANVVVIMLFGANVAENMHGWANVAQNTRGRVNLNPAKNMPMLAGNYGWACN